MSCETFDEIINNAQYVTTQWPATKQMVMKMKLLDTFGEAIFEILKGVNTDSKGDEKEKAQTEALKAGISSLFGKKDPEYIASLLKEILTCGATKREGVRITPTKFDEIYNDAGLGEMYKACMFVIKSNYSDLFKGQSFGGALAMVEEQL